MYCRECMHWELYSSGLGGCLSPKWFSGNNSFDIDVFPDGVILENPSIWGMLSAPGFGCVHFAEKDKKLTE